MPTPSRPPRPESRALPLAALGLWLAATAPAQAHENHVHADMAPPTAAAAQNTDPGTPGVSPFIGAGWRYLAADGPAPAARLPGVLESGAPRGDGRGGEMDYVELGAHLRLAPRWDAQLKLARHGEGDGAMETEAAWLRGRGDLANGVLTGVLGRQQAAVGHLNREHSHAWLFGEAPLIYRAALGDSWRDDGLQMDWQSAGGWQVGGSLLRGKSPPGANRAGVGGVIARGGYVQGPWRVELALARVEAPGRALDLKSSNGAGHSHALADCDTLANDRVCLDGNARLAALSAAWSPVGSDWRLSGEYWIKQDRGTLANPGASVDYRGRSAGGWLQLGWTPSPAWEGAVRVERLVSRHTLDGVGASLLALQAGLADADQHPTRIGAALSWRPDRWQRIALELHHQQDAGTADEVVMLRYQLSFSPLFARGH